MQQLNLYLLVKKQVQYFLIYKSISLIFNDKKQSAILILTNILQNSFILLIFFLMYISFLFKKIQITDM